MAYLVTRLPLLARPFIKMSAKSISHLSFLILPTCLKNTEMTSASPLGFAEKYQTLLDLFPLVKSYSLSLVMEVTAKRLMYDGPLLPSR